LLLPVNPSTEAKHAIAKMIAVVFVCSGFSPHRSATTMILRPQVLTWMRRSFAAALWGSAPSWHLSIGDQEQHNRAWFCERSLDFRSLPPGKNEENLTVGNGASHRQRELHERLAGQSSLPWVSSEP